MVTTVFPGLGVDLLKSKFFIEGILSYYTTFLTHDQIFFFLLFPSDSYYHNNGGAKPFVLNNVDYLEIYSDTL